MTSRNARAALALAALIAIPALLAACGGGASPGAATPSPSGPAASAAASAMPASGSPTAGVSIRPASTPAPTTATAWGAIRDALPEGFPVYPGAKPVEVDEAVSAAFSTTADVADVAARLQSDLEAAGYATEALSGPLEDGSLVVDSVGADPACRVQTTIRPTGGTTTITVLLAAACPWQ